MVKGLFLVLIGIWCSVATFAQQITGVVLDKTTGEGVPFATLFYKGHNIGSTSDVDGRFTIDRHNGLVLYISSVGYKEQPVTISKATGSTLTIQLEEDSQMLAEVVVKPPKQKYSRKNNPAVGLMRRVVAKRDSSRLENHDYYQYNKYQKLAFALNEYEVKTDSTVHDRFTWNKYTEISPYNGKPIMPLSVNETVRQHVYRKSPQNDKDIVQGISSSGLNELVFMGDAVNTMLKEVFQDVNINDDYVRLLQYPFPSPIGKYAVGFYHFYLEDTVQVDKQECYHLRFFPNNQQDFGFNGELFVLKDSTLHVKKCSLTLPKKSDVNFVDNMHITQEFTQLENGEWVLTTDDMWAEMTVLKKKMLVVRNTRLSDYAFDTLPKSLFYGKAHEKTVANAHNRDDDFWNQYRAVQLTEKEEGISAFMEQLKQYKGMKVPLFLVQCFLDNYIETGNATTRSKFDVGPVISTFSSNFVDGFRLRGSGRTTAALNPHWFWEGYYAHGFKSGKDYYGSKVTYSFDKKKNSPFEFPQRSISFETTRDIMSPSDKFLVNDKDNMLVNIKTETVNQMYFYNRQKLAFTCETDYGLYLNADLKTESNEVAGDLHFIRLSDGMEQQKFRTTEASVEVKYCPGQTFINTKQQRFPVNYDNPEFTIRHTMGFNGLLGGDYRMNETSLSIYKRQWLGSYGYIDVHLNAAAQWNKLPFPLLMTPPIDLSYIEQEGTFNLLHNMEFFMDRKLFWSVSWDMNGKLFNRIPLLKKLKLREYVALKGVYGKLTDKNNPTLAINQQDDQLFQLPEGSYVMDATRPYMEVVAGIHNILKFFAVDWVHRLSYNDHPNTTQNGVRFALIFSF